MAMDQQAMDHAASCIHLPTSPGQKMCKCEDVRMNLELLVEAQAWQIVRLEYRLQRGIPRTILETARD